MKVFELTSGLIAAVLVALGAYQYVNSTKVEEEPVVENDMNTSQLLATVTYGVTDEDDGRLYLTDEEIDLEDGDCGQATYPCKVVFDPTVVTIKMDSEGRPYIDEQQSNPQYTAIGQGPFTP